MNSQSPRRTPDWMLERIALGELPPEELAAARERLAQEPGGPERLAALEADGRATLERLPPERVAREVEARFRRPPARAPARPAWVRPAWGLVPVLATVALFVLARPPAETTTGEGVGGPVAGDFEPTRSKGLLPRLEVHRQRGQGGEALADGSPVAAGDRVQLSYIAAGRTHGVIVSVDGRGAVTLHVPEEGMTQAAALSPSGTQRVGGSYELDDAPRFERFFLVTAEHPFALEPVLAAARTLAASADAHTGSLSLAEDLTQVSFTLEKQR
ncbi:ActD-like protein [Myxococcus sp. K15C18031901]|uniref:ActD-like protein n=1 Tax=Myxococcus dinghuensis TaxID=2906761 RepID=UPI0020A7B215|nr:ActD-like protein [Myxococcus dinghuensis]MCP3099175.1 ActD-like protein [Myxococcus dinghuensis]